MENSLKSPGLEVINEQIDKAVMESFGPTFKFRPNQKEAVASTIDSWLNGTDNVIISAPTGSGKSITALTIAAVLTKFYNMSGYILASDLNLIDQYQRDVEKYFPEWAVIKGQQTYRCSENGLNFSSGACKLKGCKSYGDIKKKFPICSAECPYIVERDKAIHSDLLVCTYSFWLIQQNLVKPKLPEPPFTERNFTICDEAHKLVGIIQNHFSPKMVPDDIGKMKNIVEFGLDNDTIIDEIETIRKKIISTDDNDRLIEYLIEYNEKMKVIGDGVDTIKRDISEKTDRNEQLSKEDKTLAYNCEFLDNHITGFSDYVDIIQSVGIYSMVKNYDDLNRDVITFNCIDESYLMNKHFHRHCVNKMYMSATIGDPNEFAKDCSFSNFNSIDIPSTFDFTNSPIFYIPDYRLSYTEKEMNFPKVAELIDYTINMYAGRRGIIQTGSYKFAKSLADYLGPAARQRLILYDDTKEKTDALEYFKMCNDKILVGPSLIEGLSFDDDLCRFQIIMKVPYPSLADKFVKAKKDINPAWYSNTTAISILQGVGRGIRNENDWCVTFIFDGCYSYLMRNAGNMFNNDFMKRIQVISPNSIVPKNN
jgi:Rad3-related DNA helicase